MYLSKLPKVGGTVNIGWSNFGYSRERRVLSIRPYTGSLAEYYTHVVKVEAPWLVRGWTERSINVASHRKK